MKTDLNDIHVNTEEQSLSVDDSDSLVTSQSQPLIHSDKSCITEVDQQIINAERELLSGRHMLHVPEGDTTILAGVSSTIQVATSLAFSSYGTV